MFLTFGVVDRTLSKFQQIDLFLRMVLAYNSVLQWTDTCSYGLFKQSTFNITTCICLHFDNPPSLFLGQPIKMLISAFVTFDLYFSMNAQVCIFEIPYRQDKGN